MNFLKTPILHPYLLLSESKGFIGVNLKRIAANRPGVLVHALSGIVDLVMAGRIKPVVDSVHGFDSVAMAHERLHSRQSIGKVVVSVKE